jgi:hypothetical protein
VSPTWLRQPRNEARHGCRGEDARTRGPSTVARHPQPRPSPTRQHLRWALYRRAQPHPAPRPGRQRAPGPAPQPGDYNVASPDDRNRVA